MTNISLTPLFRQSVGFDRLTDLFQSAFEGEEKATVAYPPYNIEKTSHNTYVITMAVAGFLEEDLTIVTQDDRIIITGRLTKKSSEKETEFLYRGIATRSFERAFRLADYMKVSEASLDHGLLTIQLIREIPEAIKPRTIPIKGKNIKIEQHLNEEVFTKDQLVPEKT